jgi:hypothetical protein
MSNRGKIGLAVVVLLVLCICVIGWRALRNPETQSAPGPVASAGPPPQLAPQPPPQPPSTPEAPPIPDASPTRPDDLSRGVAVHTSPAFQPQKDEPEPPKAQPSASATAAEAASAPPAVSAAASAPVAAQAPVAAPVVSVAPPALTGQALGRFRNNVSSAYRMVSVTCSIDGAVTFATTSGAAETQMFDRRLSPGNHTLSVVAEYQGQGGGVFSYVQGYHFKIQGGRAFTVRPNAVTQIGVTAYERGGPTTKFEDRLALAVDMR